MDGVEQHGRSCCPHEGLLPAGQRDHVKTREAERIVSVAVIVAGRVNIDGQREVLGLKAGAGEAAHFWTEFLHSLNRRGLRGVKLVICDSHDGINAAAS